MSWEMSQAEREHAIATRLHLHFVASGTPWRCIAALPWCFAPALWQAWWRRTQQKGAGTK